MPDLTVPPEAYEAAGQALYEYDRLSDLDEPSWESLNEADQQSYITAAKPTVDAAWVIAGPLAVAEGRRQAAEAIWPHVRKSGFAATWED